MATGRASVAGEKRWRGKQGGARPRQAADPHLPICDARANESLGLMDAVPESRSLAVRPAGA